MTTPAQEITSQPALPFAECDLLRVRILPAEYARSLGVHKSTVCRWLKNGTISAGADGRIDPQRATRQLLRNGDPGRFRARLLRQAYADVNDLRTQADRAAQLEQELLDLRLAAAQERERADDDYQTLSDWLDAFERRIGAIPQEDRAALDDLAWRSHVKSLLLDIMRVADDLDEIGRQVCASLSLAMPDGYPTAAEDEEA
jgi:hypothetical protein